MFIQLFFLLVLTCGNTIYVQNLLAMKSIPSTPYILWEATVKFIYYTTPACYILCESITSFWKYPLLATFSM